MTELPKKLVEAILLRIPLRIAVPSGLTFDGIVRQPRRVFQVEVGNIPDDEIDAYVQRIIDNFRRPLVDTFTGEINFMYNEVYIDQDFFI
jgi:hypothetical protein